MIFTISRASDFNIDSIKGVFKQQIKTKQGNYKTLRFIDIKTFDHLMRLVKEFDKIIISKEGYYSKQPDIEIYDDYRE